MALIQCPECKAEISDHAASCPRCGFPLHSPPAEAPLQLVEEESPPPAAPYPYHCPMCGQGYDSKPDLYRHKRTAHPGGWSYKVKVACPHCHVTGQVATRPVKVKKGISGGKATGAIFTGGLSLLATGLSRKEGVVDAFCANCGVTWTL